LLRQAGYRGNESTQCEQSNEGHTRAHVATGLKDTQYYRKNKFAYQ